MKEDESQMNRWNNAAMSQNWVSIMQTQFWSIAACDQEMTPHVTQGQSSQGLLAASSFLSRATRSSSSRRSSSSLLSASSCSLASAAFRSSSAFLASCSVARRFSYSSCKALACSAAFWAANVACENTKITLKM